MPPKSLARVPIIRTDADVKAGIKALRRKCEVIRHMHDVAGDPPLRRRAGGFEGLARIIIGQQVSVASANAIWARFETVVQPMSAAAVGQMTDEDFKAGGLSRPKMKTFRAVAEAVAAGRLDFADLETMPEMEARAALTAISGIGPWTTDVYLMFCVGRADVFAPGDLALQVAAQLAMKLEERPSPDALAAMAAERWQPWRAVAARLLWHYYAATKAANSGLPV